MAYRPPGRSNRSGRANADNDVFEGLPVKQWSQVMAPVSLAPPKTEDEVRENDRWGEPPMPRDSQMLHPWTQLLLKLARAGKVGTKRKQDSDSAEEDKPEDEAAAAAATEEAKQHSVEDRGYVAKRWKPVPEAMLEPEHKHMEFLAKRRKGLGTLYGPDAHIATAVSMRKTHVQRTSADGEVAVYEVLVPEGQTVEGEVSEPAVLAEVKPVTAAPGTIVEGVGVANDDGVLVAEHLKPNVAPRRNRPPPKKKGGPGRGKKRVTFTNPDGSTYTTVVPNATKIVPQPGQTVKHVAKGEEATADISAEQAAANSVGVEGEDGDDGDDDDDDDMDDDDDREEGEVSETETTTAAGTPITAAKSRSVSAAPQSTVKEETSMPPADLAALSDAPPAELAPVPVVDIPTTTVIEERLEERVTPGPTDVPPAVAPQEPETSVMEAAVLEPELVEVPVINDTTMTDSVAIPDVPALTEDPVIAADELPGDRMDVDTEVTEAAAAKFEDGEEDLLGNLEKALVKETTHVEPSVEEEPTGDDNPQVEKADEQEALQVEQIQEPEVETAGKVEEQLLPADEVATATLVVEGEPAEATVEESSDVGEAKVKESVEIPATEES